MLCSLLNQSIVLRQATERTNEKMMCVLGKGMVEQLIETSVATN